MKLKLLSILFVAILAIPSASATGNNVTPAKEQVTQVMDRIFVGRGVDIHICNPGIRKQVFHYP